VVNVTEKNLVDGDLVEIKIIEEWGFNMGEEACLFEEDGSTEVTCSENDAIQEDEVANYHVDVMVDKIARDLDAEEVNDGQSDNDEWCEKVNLEVKVPTQHDSPDSPNNVTQEGAFQSKEAESESVGVTFGSDDGDVVHASLTRLSGDGKAAAMVDAGPQMFHRKRKVKSQSCSQKADQSSQSGPWSVEWLQEVQQGYVGFISSNKKRLKKVPKGGESKTRGNTRLASRKKAGGVLRHPVFTLKKVARLPSKDRAEVMKVLKNSEVMKDLNHKVRKR